MSEDSAQNDPLARRLSDGIDELGLTLTTQQQAQLLDYIDLLRRWNQIFNLTAVREPMAMISQHLLDSLTVVPYLQGDHILDVGSGAGLPGVPLAIAEPQRRFTLLDANGKKTRFLTEVVQKIDLANRVTIVKNRIEEYRPAAPFDTVICRAVASLGEFADLCQTVCNQKTFLLAMKGRRPDSELQSLDASIKVIAVTPLTVPGLTVERHLVSLQRTTA